MTQKTWIWRIFLYILFCISIPLACKPLPSQPNNPPGPQPLPPSPESTSNPLTSSGQVPQSPISQSPTPNSQPPTPSPQPLTGSLLYSSRQIDTNGDGFVQVPDAIQIYRMDLETGRTIPLTKNEAYNTYPAWSPDGTQIAYVSTASGAVDLFVMDADGENSQQLTVDSQRVSSPRWSQDGTMIVFSGGEPTSPNLYVYHMESGEVRQLTESNMADEEPDWSGNGRFILFTRQQPAGTTDSSQESGLYLFDIELDRLIKIQAKQAPLTDIRWLPESNSTFTAYEMNDPTLTSRLFELVWENNEVDLQETAVITQNALELIWLNENQFITVTPRGESSELVLISSENNPQFLTNNSFFESNIDWHP